MTWEGSSKGSKEESSVGKRMDDRRSLSLGKKPRILEGQEAGTAGGGPGSASKDRDRETGVASQAQTPQLAPSISGPEPDRCSQISADSLDVVRW